MLFAGHSKLEAYATANSLALFRRFFDVAIQRICGKTGINCLSRKFCSSAILLLTDPNKKCLRRVFDVLLIRRTGG